MKTENQQTEGQPNAAENKPDEGVQSQAPAKVELNIPAPAAEAEESTGDARKDVALGWLKQAGVARNSPAVKHAIDTGDFSLLESVLKEKGAAGFEPYVQLLQDARKDEVTKAETAKSEAKSAILKVFDTEAAWDEARAWVGANADENERRVLSGMLTGGDPTAARIAARFIQQARLAAGKPAATSGSAVKRDAGRQAPGPEGGALSPEGFTKELAKLVAEHGDRGAFSRPEYAQLRARRAAWRG